MDTDRLMEFLAKEGFRPTLEKPGEVHFKYEGGHYLVFLTPSDDQYAAVIFPNFWPLKSPDEEGRALRAAAAATTGIKLAKVHVDLDRHYVWADVELLVVAPEQFESVFQRCLDMMRAAVGRFAESMRQTEPLPDKRIELKREEVTRFLHGN